MMRRFLFGSLVNALMLLGVPGCSSDSSSSSPKPETDAGAPHLKTDCDPLVPTYCGFPFPSNVWLVDDPATPTGKHIAFGEKTLPHSGTGVQTDPSVWTQSDGFSPGVGILTHIPGATVTGLPTPDTLDASLAADCPTVLIEADTGTRVPHFSEIDATTTQDDHRAFIIRPVTRLKDATRYIVAIRRVKDSSGAAIPPTPVFKALRDGTSSDDPSVGARRALYADIFARLAKAKVAKDDLQIAWDFSTASRQNNTAR